MPGVVKHQKIWLALHCLFFNLVSAHIGAAPSENPSGKPSAIVTGITAQSMGKEWYNSSAGAAILLISLIMVAGIVYLFIRGLQP